MRWWVFVPTMFVVLVLDASLMPALAVGGHAPRLWPVLLAFVALHGSRGAALWSAVAVGLWLDALQPALGIGTDAPRAVMVFGPHMLSCAAGTWAVLESRSWLWRRNVLTLAFAALTLSVFAALAFISVAGIRASYADPSPLWGGGSGASAMGSELIDAFLTALAGIPPAWLLQATLPAWGFANAGPRFGGAGRVARAGE
jgi:hypothetical protein